MADAKTTAKAFMTDKAAREIVARQTAERDANTARLRRLRLAKEAADRVAAEEEASRKAALKAATKPKRKAAASA